MLKETNRRRRQNTPLRPDQSTLPRLVSARILPCLARTCIHMHLAHPQYFAKTDVFGIGYQPLLHPSAVVYDSVESSRRLHMSNVVAGACMYPTWMPSTVCHRS